MPKLIFMDILASVLSTFSLQNCSKGLQNTFFFKNCLGAWPPPPHQGLSSWTPHPAIRRPSVRHAERLVHRAFGTPSVRYAERSARRASGMLRMPRLQMSLAADHCSTKCLLVYHRLCCRLYHRLWCS